MKKFKGLLALDGVSILEKEIEIKKSVKAGFGDSGFIYKVLSEVGLRKLVSFHVVVDKDAIFAITELVRLVDLTESIEVKDTLIDAHFSEIKENSVFVFVVEVKK